jgi:6-pyruvoyltetrahydropterin/6-carboxytetrahydropterin synthase
MPCARFAQAGEAPHQKPPLVPVSRRFRRGNSEVRIMYTVCVRDHVMIAHSFHGELFGPAQRLHGATYVIDVELRREALDVNSVVVDIGRASDALRAIVSEFAFRNLDDDPSFVGKNTTTEFLAKVIFERMVVRIGQGELGPGSDGLSSMKVTLHESHVAWAAFEGAISG